MKNVIIFIIACCCLFTGCSPQRAEGNISANSGNNGELEHILIEHTCQYTQWLKAKEKIPYGV